MTKNFSKYSKIIQNFRGLVLLDSFESKFATATKNLSKPERFLLKMELKRLAQPCTRLIDLRGLVDGECKRYEHEERPHYLDEVAIKVFEDHITNYDGYTFGVYEAVTNTENNFRVIYQREKSKESSLPTDDINKQIEKIHYPAKLYSFGPYYNRIEERMNFAIRVDVILSQTQTIECSSSDLSVSGCKFRVLKPANIKLGQVINIRFVGLEQEFQFDNDTGFSYEIRNIQLVDNSQLVGVERILGMRDVIALDDF